jgi:hypothetical protein
MNKKKYNKIVNNADVNNIGYNTTILLSSIAFNVLITSVFVLVTR